MKKSGSLFITLFIVGLVSTFTCISAQSENASLALENLFQDVDIQTPSLRITLDDTGDASMSYIEPIDLDFDTVSGTIVAGGDSVNINMVIEDALGFIEPDYSLSLLVGETMAQFDFQIYGDSIAEIIRTSGPFELNLDVREDASMLNIDLSGYMSTFLFDEEGFDASQIVEEKEALRTEMQASIDTAMSQIQDLGIASSDIVIQSLSLEMSGTRIDFDVKLSISDWKELYSAVMQYSSGEDDDELFSCVGSNINELANNIMNSELESLTMQIKGTGDTISATAEDIVLSSDQSIKSISVSVDKSGVMTNIDAALSMIDAERMVSCLLLDYTWNGKTIDSPVLSFEKDKEDIFGTVSLNGNIEKLASESKGEWTLDVPSTVTEYFDVWVELPKGMDVKESSGADIGEDIIHAIQGASMQIKYGEKGLSIDNIYAIPLFVIVILFVLILYHKKR
jgi:hypothetical protein